MALSFIGKPISLISHSDVRYRGILAGIDPAASTIQLSNVYSMGTESRRPPAEFIPPVQEPYQYIIFRASEVKDLAVDEPAPRRSVHDDPAVLGASAPPINNQTQYAYGNQQQFQRSPGPPNAQVAPQAPQGAYPQQQQQQQQPRRAPGPDNSALEPKPAAAAPPPANRTTAPREGATGSTNSGTRHPNSVHTAAASLETIERALGDLRVSNAAAGNHGSDRGRGGGIRRGGPGRGGDSKAEIKVPNTDFDFQGSNARFDKASLAPKQTPGTSDDEGTNPSDTEDNGKDKGKEDKVAYNPQKSFFDSLSSNQGGPGAPGGHRGGGHGGEFQGRGGRRGGGGGRNRREEERERNVATFGEPGGVGLMGPGAYVGGWGGYGRRGGRPRRGQSVAGTG